MIQCLHKIPTWYTLTGVFDFFLRHIDMASRIQTLGKAIHSALQLDLFSDLLIPEKLRTRSQHPSGIVPRSNPGPELTLTPTTPQSARQRQIMLKDVVVEYELQRSKRRSIGFLINDHGLRVTAPRWVSIADIEQAIHDKQTWISRKLNERRQRVERRIEPPMQWRDGARLPYLGQDIILKIAPASTAGTHFSQATGELIINIPNEATEQQLKDRVQAWLQQQARHEFMQRLPVFAEKLNVRYHSMALSAATTRWGSCTAQGKIRLNWRLIHFSPLIIDYVVAHELAHLREMNHSPRFWATVQSVFPDFEIARHQLRQHATADLPVF